MMWDLKSSIYTVGALEAKACGFKFIEMRVSRFGDWVHREDRSGEGVVDIVRQMSLSYESQS
jgi:L-ribulose-5-phosphate 3-epimerase UlaE